MDIYSLYLSTFLENKINKSDVPYIQCINYTKMMIPIVDKWLNNKKKYLNDITNFKKEVSEIIIEGIEEYTQLTEILMKENGVAKKIMDYVLSLSNLINKKETSKIQNQIDITQKLTEQKLKEFNCNELMKTLKQHGIPRYIKMKKSELIKKITELSNKHNLPKIKKEIPKKINSKEKRVPKKLKIEIWNKFIGKKHGIGSCYVCNDEIDSKHFEAGHIKARAKGGETTIENLRPVCEPCNKSIGSMNMDDYKDKYYKKEPQFEILLKNPMNRIPGKERKSKLLDSNSKLYKFLDLLFLKLAKKYNNSIEPKRMDHHIEVV